MCWDQVIPTVKLKVRIGSRINISAFSLMLIAAKVCGLMDLNDMMMCLSSLDNCYHYGHLYNPGDKIKENCNNW